MYTELSLKLKALTLAVMINGLIMGSAAFACSTVKREFRVPVAKMGAAGSPLGMSKEVPRLPKSV